MRCARRRWPAARRSQLLSRETVLLVGNLMFTVAAAMVLLGTLFPLIGDALNLGRISVGPPYFGFLFPLLMAPVVLLLPFGPFLRWGTRRVAVLEAACCCAPASPPWPAPSSRRSSSTANSRPSPAWPPRCGCAVGVLLYVYKRWREVPARPPLPGRNGRHAAGPLRRRRVPGRRAAVRIAERDQRRAHGSRPDRDTSAATTSASTACTATTGPELARRPGRGHGHPRRRDRSP